MCRALHGIDNPEGIETLAGRNQRLLLPPDDPAELLDLEPQPLAEAAGEERFRDAAHRPWAMAFARAASAALAKPVVSIDVPKQSLTY